MHSGGGVEGGALEEDTTGAGVDAEWHLGEGQAGDEEGSGAEGEEGVLQVDSEELPPLPAVTPLAPQFPGHSVVQHAPATWSTGELVGETIGVRWPDDEGNWLLGEVRLQRGRKQGAQRHYKQHKQNYDVYYPGDNTKVSHELNDRTYNPSADAPREAWVLLRPV
jgi:hypothetical protein